MKAKPDSKTDLVTLMYVPSSTGQIHRLNFPRTWMRRATGAGVALAVLFLVAGVDYVRARVQLVELDYLRSEAQEQRNQLEEYAVQMTEISQDLERIASFDRKLRVITNLDPSDSLPLPGIGGVDGELVDPEELDGMTRDRRHRRLLDGLSAIDEAAGAQAESLSALVSHLETQTARLSATPSVTPTRGWMTSSFGYRVSPFTGNREFHRGVDIAGRLGTPVLAPADGEVRFAAKRRGLGNTVMVRHGYSIETRYGHLQEITVQVGDKVKRGQQIGLLGSTGRSTGPHLHYQVEVAGKPVNPRNYILD